VGWVWSAQIQPKWGRVGQKKGGTYLAETGKLKKGTEQLKRSTFKEKTKNTPTPYRGGAKIMGFTKMAQGIPPTGFVVTKRKGSA